MALRLMLLNDYLGPFIIDHNDPIDINSVKQTIKRSADNDGVVFEVILDLEFIKEGLEYLKTAYEQAGGIDAIVAVNLYDYDPNLRRWNLWNVFTVVFKGPIEETQIGVALEQIGVQRRILNLLGQEVDQETLVSEDGSSLPAQTVIDLALHSKTIRRQFSSSNALADMTYPPDDGFAGSKTLYFIPTLNPSKCDEIDDRFDYASEIAERHPLDNKLFIFKVKEQGAYTFSINLYYEYATSSSGAPTSVVKWWFVYGNLEAGYNFEQIGSTDTMGPLDPAIRQIKTIQRSFNLSQNDEIYIYAEFAVTGVGGGDNTTIFFKPSYLSTPITVTLVGLTTFEATSTRAILPHEAVQRTLQYYTNQVNCFHSTLLGRAELGYDSDGEYSMVAITNGANIRGLTGEPATNGNPICNGEDPETLDKRKIFTSFKQLHEFFNSVACTGFGFQTIDGAPILRYEKKSFFYDKTTRILSLGKVYKPKKDILHDKYYNAVTYGYSEKIDSRNVNGIDEFNTSRNSSLPIVNSKDGIDITTRVIASGYLIEAQRRLKYKTEDGPKDDSLFAICARKDGSNWVAKKNEGYSSIENVIDPPTGYNYDISPARNLINWYPYLASGLQRSFSKVIKFLSGTVNYFMVTTKTGQTALPENGSVDLTGVSPLWDNELYIIENVPFTREYMKLIQANPYGFIDFQDYNNVTYKGFISEIEVDPNKRQANLKLLRCPD